MKMTITDPIGNPTTSGLVNVNELDWKDWNYGDKFGGRTRNISDAVNALQIGVVLEELPPARQSCPAHYHLSEEEHVWILRGEVTLKVGDEVHHLREGHYISFLAGVEQPHYLINETDNPCLYLVIGQRRKDDVVVYPHSNKIMVRMLDRVYKNKPVEYWLDE
jgi:uncharacterized cupin superfamily protein